MKKTGRRVTSVVLSLLMVLSMLAVGMVSGVAAGTTTVYYCPKQAWLDAGYTIKANGCGSNNENKWTQLDMKDTGDTVNGNPVYVAVFNSTATPYGGFDKLQFQAYQGSTWKEQIVAISSWTTTGTIDGKFYNGSAWVAYTPDATEPPTQPPTEAPTEEPTVAPTQAPTEDPSVAPTQAPTVDPTEPTQAPTDAPTEAPTEAPQPRTIYFDSTGTNWSEVYIFGWNFGLNGFAPMTLVEGNVYSYTFAQGTVDGTEGFLFTNKTDWSDQQTINVSTVAGKNFYTKLAGGGKTWAGTWDVYTPAEPTQPTEAPTEAPTVAPTEEPTVVPTEAPTEEPTVEPTTPVEYVTVSFDSSATDWANVRAYAYKDGGTAKNAAWPGADAISVEGSVYTFQLEKGAYDKIIFNNAAAGAATATEQTVTINLEEGVTYKATAKDLSGLWDVEGGTPIIPAMITVYFTNNKNWTDIKAHIYNASSNKGTTWPGIAMDLFGKNNMGQDVYSVSFDTNKYDTVIFSGGNGSVQTVNITAADKTGYYLLNEMDGKKYKVGSYGMFEVTFEDTDGNVLGQNTVAEGETAQTPSLPTYKDKEYVAQFAPDDLKNITADKTLTYALQAKTFTVSLAAPDETVTLNGGTDGVFAYGDTATLICTADDFAYWTINGKIVSYDKAYAYIVTADGVVEAVKSETPVVKNPSISVDGVVFDTVTDPSKILMYFGVNTLNPGDAPRYGVFRFVGNAPADAEAAIQNYLDNGEASAYNSYIKEYTDSGVMNSDGRYNYVASAPVGVSADKTMTVYAFVVVDGVLYISNAVTATPGTLS